MIGSFADRRLLITVDANWRIIFRFENGRAFEIELIDYH